MSAKRRFKPHKRLRMSNSEQYEEGGNLDGSLDGNQMFVITELEAELQAEAARRASKRSRAQTEAIIVMRNNLNPLGLID